MQFKSPPMPGECSQRIQRVPKSPGSLRSGLQFYGKISKPTQAARFLVDGAKLFRDNNDLGFAVEALTDAAQLSGDENQPMSAVTHLSDIAVIKSMQKNWLGAAQCYTHVGMRRMGDRLTQLAARGLFTKGVICQLAANDSVGGETMLSHLVWANISWDRSR
jgi:hypothetical protein